jgi:RNA 3'-terminal phosphate cyclase (ATP)
MAQRAQKLLQTSLGFQGSDVAIGITPQRVRGAGPGAAIFLVTEYDQATAGFSALGKKGKPAETVADQACSDLLEHHGRGAAVDPYLGDQLLLPLALASGRSVFQTSRLTGHLLTNAQIIQQFIPAKISIEGLEGSPGTVVVEGVGFP